MGDRLSVIAYQSQINAERRTALSGFKGVALIRRLPFHRSARGVHGANGREFGHAPGINDLHTQLILEILNQALRTTSAACDEPPERGRARAHGAIVVD